MISRIPRLARPVLLRRTTPVLFDALIFAAILAAFYGLLAMARYWVGAAIPVTDISRSPWALPRYAFYSVMRIAVAYVASLFFAVAYGYIAAYNRLLQGFMVAVLDILQSIPVLSFLPGVMLAMVALFPQKQLGIELGSIILIFTGQVWNMAFSFYSSLRSIPRELREAAAISRFSKWQRFLQLELPFGAIGLVWNSIVSVAGGWFFLMACEMFVLGNRDFRLPGLGSYLQIAASAGDTRSMLWGLATMIGVIILIDQLIWGPVIAWSDKFKFEQVEGEAPRSALLHILRTSPALEILRRKTLAPIAERLDLYFAKLATAHTEHSVGASRRKELAAWISAVVCVFIAIIAIVYCLIQALALLAHLHSAQILGVLQAAGATFLRVNSALVIASVWTIPAGVLIGFHPKLARIAQPLTQIAASVPATALFPVLLLGIVQIGGGLGVGSILLMLLGTQWYILFNVIAGASAVPSDLKEVADLFHFSSLDRWRTVILPGIFPYLVTGLVTASGGAWNASIVAEYFHFKNQVMSTVGLGAQISAATDAGRFDILLLATVIMAALVVSINRLVWRPLYRLAETKYRLES
ncbi:MAG: ABC transporter permease subunit [Acidobacteriaceae bacterium]|nr:ABC transporter permease subunit [Acidobacteriaceae bacterium]MBV9779661.1 ABC transporter permease subunit [Acidobacteriaceae bacterium]